MEDQGKTSTKFTMSIRGIIQNLLIESHLSYWYCDQGMVTQASIKGISATRFFLLFFFRFTENLKVLNESISPNLIDYSYWRYN